MRIAGAATFIAAAFQSLSAGAADVQNGAIVAAEYCTRCHDISEGGARKTMPPSFASIAEFRAEDQIFMRIMFPQMHSPMPAWSMMLSRDEVEDLTGYIMSLESEGSD